VAEEHWLRYGVTARRKRNVRRLGALQALRESRRAYRATVGKAAISATPADASGKLVIEADRIAKSYDGRPIVHDFSIRIQRGERGRLMLARALAKPSNLLVLDEPTNDLDLETLDVLEEMLADYAGTIILSSHDRDFLDRVVNAVIVPDGGGRWLEYAGGYSDMLAQRGQDLRQIAREGARPAPAKESKDLKATAPARKQGKRR